MSDKIILLLYNIICDIVMVYVGILFGGILMKEELGSVVVKKEEIEEMVEKLAKQISTDYKDKELVLVGVLKGGFVFLADLMRKLTIPVGIDFISVSSYGSSTDSSGIVKIAKDLDIDIKDKHVLIVEDIVDTGLTLRHLKDIFTTREPKSVKICTAFDKPARRKEQITVEYVGIQVPDKFLVGYGLDFDERNRSLPYVREIHIDKE